MQEIWDNPYDSEKRYWLNYNNDKINKHFLCSAGSEYDDDWCEDYMLEPFWLSEAKVGDQFYYNCAKPFLDKKWVKATIINVYADVVFFTREPLNFEPNKKEYEWNKEIEHFDIGSQINQYGALFRLEHDLRESTYDRKHLKVYCNCPYTKIIDIEGPEENDED